MTTDYNSFFEIFTAINLAYAGSENFRDKIDGKILNISSSFVTHKNIIRENIALLRADRSNEETVNLFARKTNLILNVLFKQLESAPRRLECSDLFKSAFLFSGFYCLLILTCSALIANNVHKDASKTIIILTSCMTAFYNVSVFILSFTKLSNKKIKTIIPIGIYLITIIISAVIAHCDGEKNLEGVIKIIWSTDRKYFIYAAFFIALSPIVLHILRSLIILANIFIKNLYGRWLTQALYFECADIYSKLYDGISTNKKRGLFHSCILKRFEKKIKDRRIGRKKKTRVS